MVRTSFRCSFLTCMKFFFVFVRLSTKPVCQRTFLVIPFSLILLPTVAEKVLCNFRISLYRASLLSYRLIPNIVLVTFNELFYYLLPFYDFIFPKHSDILVSCILSEILFTIICRHLIRDFRDFPQKKSPIAICSRAYKLCCSDLRIDIGRGCAFVEIPNLVVVLLQLNQVQSRGLLQVYQLYKLFCL